MLSSFANNTYPALFNSSNTWVGAGIQYVQTSTSKQTSNSVVRVSSILMADCTHNFSTSRSATGRGRSLVQHYH